MTANVKCVFPEIVQCSAPLPSLYHQMKPVLAAEPFLPHISTEENVFNHTPSPLKTVFPSSGVPVSVVFLLQAHSPIFPPHLGVLSHWVYLVRSRGKMSSISKARKWKVGLISRVQASPWTGRLERGGTVTWPLLRIAVISPTFLVTFLFGNYTGFPSLFPCLSHFWVMITNSCHYSPYVQIVTAPHLSPLPLFMLSATPLTFLSRVEAFY